MTIKAPTTESESRLLQRNTLFYWKCVKLLVQDELFCVPQHELVNSSPVLSKIILEPTSSNAGSSGPADNNEADNNEEESGAIVLKDCDKRDFVALLKVMYPTTSLNADLQMLPGSPSVPSFGYELEKDEWTGILRLAQKWRMEAYRKYAVHRLSNDFSMSPIEKILLAREHRVPKWFEEGIMELTGPDAAEPMDIDALSSLGWETAARILAINVLALKNSQSPLTPEVGFRLDSIACPWNGKFGMRHCAKGRLVPNNTQTCYNCNTTLVGETLLPYYPSEADDDETQTPPASAQIQLSAIECPKCRYNIFVKAEFVCKACTKTVSSAAAVWVEPVRLKQNVKEMIGRSFQQEIEQFSLDLEAPITVTPGPS